MSNTLWLINPHTRGETGRAAKMANAKKPRTAAQKAATAKLVAANKKRRAAAGKTVAAPAKAKAKRSYAKAATPKKVYKRNPIGSNASVKRGKGMFEENIKPAAMGAAAALGFDIAWGKLTTKIGLPTNLITGTMQYPVKALAAIGLGMAAERFLPKQHKHHAVTLVRGPLTVILHDAAYSFTKANYPSLGLAEYEDHQQMAEIMHEMNGIEDEVEYYEEPQTTVGETLRLQGLSEASSLYVPQYDGVAY